MKKNLRVFIGSSTNYAPKKANGKDVDRTKTVDELIADEGFKLREVFSALKEIDCTPIPWWDENVWKDSESFWNSLTYASNFYDGGIFIFGKDEKVHDDQKKSEFFVTRGNVLIEFGMFYALKGKNRTLAIFDKETEPGDMSNEEYLPPSDLTGITYPTLGDKESLKARVKSFFLREPEETGFDEITYYVNSNINQEKVYKNYSNWRTKGLYIGSKSSELWDKIESHPNYNRYIQFVNNFVTKEVDPKIINNIDNVVSLGTGNGVTDSSLVTALRVINERIRYVPIDINPMLVHRAIKRVSSDKLTRVPFAIIDDFESNHNHIKEVIEGKAHKIGKNNLFAMLGVTFSNLEQNEYTWFVKIKDWMGIDDYFLLDVVFKSGSTDSKLDELKKILLSDESPIPEYRELISNSFIKKYYYSRREKGSFYINKDQKIEIEKSPKDYFKVVQLNQKEASKYSWIPKTDVYACRYCETNAVDTELLILKSYDLESFEKYIKDYFVIESDRKKFENDSDEVNRSLYLLRKKRRNE